MNNLLEDTYTVTQINYLMADLRQAAHLVGNDNPEAKNWLESAYHRAIALHSAHYGVSRRPDDSTFPQRKGE